MPDQLVSSDPNWGGTTSGPVWKAPSETEPVTWEELRDNPHEAILRIGRLIGHDLQDPKVLAGVLASVFVPKMVGAVMPAPGAPSVMGRIGPAVRAAAPNLAKAALGYRTGQIIEAGQKGAAAYRGAAETGGAGVVPGAGEMPAATTTPTPSALPARVPEVPPSPGPAPSPLALASKLRLSAQEFQQAAQWAREGKSLADIEQRIQATRALQGSGAFAHLPTSLDVARRVGERNIEGRWPE